MKGRGDPLRPDAQDPRPHDTVLNGWKGIAAHLGKSPRTAIRWERSRDCWRG